MGGIANIGETMSRLSLFPLTAEVNDRGHLIIGGGDTVEPADEFGTLLYLFDERDYGVNHAYIRKGY